MDFEVFFRGMSVLSFVRLKWQRGKRDFVKNVAFIDDLILKKNTYFSR